MSLEAGTRIADLVPTNPVGATDFASQGDDHIRLIKACLQGSFPSLGATAVARTAAELNDIVMKSVAQTITQLLTLSGGLTVSGGAVTLPAASLADAALSSNVVLKNVQPDFTAGVMRARLTGTTNGQYVSWRFAAKTSGGAASEYEIGSNLSTDNELSIFDNTAGAIISRYIRGTGWQWFTNSGTMRLSIPNAGGLSVAVPDSGTALTVRGLTNGYAITFSDGVAVTGGHYLNGTASIRYGSVTNHPIEFMVNEGVKVTINAGVQVGAPTGGDKGAGTINAAGEVFENAQALGYKNLYSRAFTGNTSTAASDNGKSVEYAGAGGHTLTLDADLPDNGVMMVFNSSAVDLAIAAAASLFWFPGAGSAPTTGARTLAAGSICTVRHYGGGSYYIWGNGLS